MSEEESPTRATVRLKSQPPKHGNQRTQTHHARPRESGLSPNSGRLGAAERSWNPALSGTDTQDRGRGFPAKAGIL